MKTDPDAWYKYSDAFATGHAPMWHNHRTGATISTSPGKWHKTNADNNGVWQWDYDNGKEEINDALPMTKSPFMWTKDKWTKDDQKAKCEDCPDEITYWANTHTGLI